MMLQSVMAIGFIFIGVALIVVFVRLKELQEELNEANRLIRKGNMSDEVLKKSIDRLNSRVVKIEQQRVYIVKNENNVIYDFDNEGVPLWVFESVGIEPLQFTIERAIELAEQYGGRVHHANGKGLEVKVDD